MLLKVPPETAKVVPPPRLEDWFSSVIRPLLTTAPPALPAELTAKATLIAVDEDSR